MTGSQVLVVDDDDDLREVITAALSGSGYQTLEAANGEEALQRIQDYSPDLVLLDIALGPGSIDGLEVCRRIRLESDVPVIFLSNHSEDVDQILGFSAGADDYLGKPVHLRLLLARVGAILRRAEGVQRSTEPPVLTLDGLHIDVRARTVAVNEQHIDLTRIQFDLLVALARNPKRVLTREQLVERVWGDWFGDQHHLDVHLSRLRQRILDAGGPRVAHAVRGVGFRFTE